MGKAVKSAKRALEVLELFAMQGSWLSVSDVARSLDYPQSSTSILLKELAVAGHLELDAGKRLYRPAIRTAILGGQLASACETGLTLESLARELHSETGEEIVLAEQRAIHVRYIHMRKATLPFFGAHRLGALRPLCRTSMGKALLSGRAVSEVGKIVRHVNACDARSPILLAELASELAEVRERGYATAFDEATPGAAGIAVAVPPMGDHPSLALAICGLSQRIRDRREELADALKAAVGRLSLTRPRIDS
jgi:IclR family acetate operon transcriptional repressor